MLGMSGRRARTASWLIGLGTLLATNMCVYAEPARAQRVPGSSGISASALWVNARLGQPDGGGGPRAGISLSGRALRYIRLGAQNPCTPVAFTAPSGIEPWFGIGADPKLATESVEVVSVNRQNPSDQVPLGFGCVNPGVLVQVPSVGEILSVFRSQHIPIPVVASEDSPSRRPRGQPPFAGRPGTASCCGAAGPGAPARRQQSIPTGPRAVATRSASPWSGPGPIPGAALETAGAGRSGRSQ